MKLELGKSYLCRDGEKATIIFEDETCLDADEGYRYVAIYLDMSDRESGYSVSWVDHDGRGMEGREYDLMAPWEEPKPPRKLYAYTNEVTYSVQFRTVHQPADIGFTRAPEYDIEYPGKITFVGYPGGE